MNEVIETPYMRMHLENGILYCIFADRLEMNVNIARHCVLTRLAFSKENSYPCLIDMRGLKSATKEAREYMATEGARQVKAGALIVGSALTRMLGNIFISLNKPKAPTHLFTSEAEAKKWLQKYKARSHA